MKEFIKANPWLALALLAFVVFVWMGRFSISATDRGTFRLDRWTGDIEICGPTNC